MNRTWKRSIFKEKRRIMRERWRRRRMMRTKGRRMRKGELRVMREGGKEEKQDEMFDLEEKELNKGTNIRSKWMQVTETLATSEHQISFQFSSVSLAVVPNFENQLDITWIIFS